MQQEVKPVKVKVKNGGLEEEYVRIGADERTVKIFSTKLGQAAGDGNSFLNQLCEEINTTSPKGIKFHHMQNGQFKSSKQQCEIKSNF